MPSLQNLVLKDRAATPVNHTFVPKDVQNGVGMVKESTGLPMGDKRFSVSCKQTGSGGYKAKITLTIPVTVTSVDGVTTVDHVNSFSGEFNFAEKSTEQERNDLVGMLADSLGTSKTLVNDAVVKLEGVYG